MYANTQSKENYVVLSKLLFMKKTIFIIVSWVVGIFLGAYICVACSEKEEIARIHEKNGTQTTTQQTESPVQETPSPPIYEKSGKVLASFVANGVWYFRFSAYSPCAASVPFAYFLLDNGDVVIVYPSTPSTHSREAYCEPPFTKEVAKIILEAQLGKQPSVVYR